MDNIEAFWKVFEDINLDLEGENPSLSAMDDLLEELNNIDTRLYYHLGSKDDGTDLILSAEGHADLMMELIQLKDAAPKIPNWGIVTSYDGMLLFGERNKEIFPLTQNGDVLFRMAQNGDRLWEARDVNYALVFPNEESALKFKSEASKDTQACEVSEYDGAPGYPYQADVTIELIPSCNNITNKEAYFGELAANFGGRNDGWGCFEKKS